MLISYWSYLRVFSTYITPKTPAGERPGLSGVGAVAPQAAELRTSKKYVHWSMVPTKDTVAWEAGVSRSQRNDMMVDLVRAAFPM